MPIAIPRQLLVVTVAILAGCAGATTPDGFGPSTDAALLRSSLPPLPANHDASTINTTETDGRYTVDRSLNAIDNNQALDLISGSNELSWGIWVFNPVLEKIESLQVVMTVPDGDQAWIALSDYSQGSWQIDGPLAAGKSLILDDARHRSSVGTMYVAAVTSGGDQATVYKLVVTSDDGWAIVTVDDLGNVGGHNSLSVINGKPAISYYSFSQNDLKYASSATTTGSNAVDWSLLTVDSAGEVGNYSSLAEVEGQPAISYQDWSNSALKYARRGAGDIWTAVTVQTSDIGEKVGEFTSLAVVNGYPLITHHDSDGGRLLHAQSITPTGMLAADWQNYVTDNAEDAVGMYNSLAVVDGKAAVSYAKDYTVNGLIYKWFSDPTKVRVDSPNGEARYTSLAVVDGKPSISWYDTGFGFVRYSYSSTVTGTNNSDWSTIFIDYADNINSPTSLALIDGRPAICYAASTSPSSVCLKFAWSTTPAGHNEGDWQRVIVDDSTIYTGSFASLAEVDGKPAVSYYDGSTGSLKYAIRLGS